MEGGLEDKAKRNEVPDGGAPSIYQVRNYERREQAEQGKRDKGSMGPQNKRTDGRGRRGGGEGG